MIPGGDPNLAVANFSAAEPAQCNDATEGEFFMEETEPTADAELAIEPAESEAIEPTEAPLTARS